MKIFDRTRIGNMTLRNRIYMAPMGTSTDPDGSFSDRSIRYYEERAKGGFGLIITVPTRLPPNMKQKPVIY